MLILLICIFTSSKCNKFYSILFYVQSCFFIDELSNIGDRKWVFGNAQVTSKIVFIWIEKDWAFPWYHVLFILYIIKIHIIWNCDYGWVFMMCFSSAVLQYHRQQELLSSLLKQQHSAQNVSQSTLLQRRQRPSTKEIPLQQALGLPTLGISPRQSPLPSDVSSAISSQGRIPSPLGLFIALFNAVLKLKIKVFFKLQI